jgi:hypothetical protein
VYGERHGDVRSMSLRRRAYGILGGCTRLLHAGERAPASTFFTLFTLSITKTLSAEQYHAVTDAVINGLEAARKASLLYYAALNERRPKDERCVATPNGGTNT